MNAIVSRFPKSLSPFLSVAQRHALGDALRGEEGEWFTAKLAEVAAVIEGMPTTYQTDGTDAVVYLHYFTGGCDWYITEKDVDGGVDQAFGIADLGYGGEMGYISIREIVATGAELDLHWTPKPKSQI